MHGFWPGKMADSGDVEVEFQRSKERVRGRICWLVMANIGNIYRSVIDGFVLRDCRK